MKTFCGQYRAERKKKENMNTQCILVNGVVLPASSGSFKEGFAHLYRANDIHYKARFSDQNWPLLVEIAASLYDAENKPVKLSI